MGTENLYKKTVQKAWNEWCHRLGLFFRIFSTQNHGYRASQVQLFFRPRKSSVGTKAAFWAGAIGWPIAAYFFLFVQNFGKVCTNVLIMIIPHTHLFPQRKDIGAIVPQSILAT
jgi:hypothetical protein